jgi:hypothetical protein
LLKKRFACLPKKRWAFFLDNKARDTPVEIMVAHVENMVNFVEIMVTSVEIMVIMVILTPPDHIFNMLLVEIMVVSVEIMVRNC